MPALVMLGRKWKVGSDDFVYGSIFLLILRISWIVTLVAVFCQHVDVFQCTGKRILTVYFVGMLLLLSAKVFLNLAILMTSMSGSIMYSQPRKHLPYFLVGKFVSTILEIVWTSVGTYWAFDDSGGCDPEVIETVKILVAVGWLCTSFALISLVLSFDIFGTSSGDHKQSTKSWQRICRLVCCHLRNDDTSNDAFSDLAYIFSTFFRGDDLVPTDIVAGLIVLSHLQENELDDSTSCMELPTYINHRALAANSHALNGAAKPWMTIDNASYYMKYALASYGWPFYAFRHLPCGWCRLCFINKRGCCVSKGTFPNLKGDNCCHCNASAIGHTIDLLNTDIIYATFENNLYEPAFFIGVDRIMNAVVISIRGTLSLKDAVTDLVVTEERINVPQMQSSDCTVHKGIFKCAKRLYEKIEASQYLEEAFNENPNYGLVITGHSLGGGVASLLSILFQTKYPSVRCYSFSPPGCLMSKNAADQTEDYILSVVVGDDLVPRLGLRAVELLRSNITTAIASTNIPKYKILAHGVCSLCCRKCMNFLKPEEDQIPLLRSTYMSLERDDIDCHTPVTAPKMFIAGQIMSIAVTDAEAMRDNPSLPKFSWSWKSKEEFDEVRVTKTMLSHHMPDFVDDCLTALTEQVEIL